MARIMSSSSLSDIYHNTNQLNYGIKYTTSFYTLLEVINDDTNEQANIVYIYIRKMGEG